MTSRKEMRELTMALKWSARRFGSTHLLSQFVAYAVVNELPDDSERRFLPVPGRDPGEGFFLSSPSRIWLVFPLYNKQIPPFFLLWMTGNFGAITGSGFSLLFS